MPKAKKISWVLVAESEKNSREALTEILSDAGYHVLAASGGSETIEMLTRESFDLVLCDIDYPRKSGLEIVRMARALNQKAKIIAVTSAGSPAVRTRMKKEGAFELLDKPLRKAALLEAVGEALKRPPARRRKEASRS